MLDFGTELNYYWRSFIRILYPANCVLCQIPLMIEEIHLCISCVKKIEPLKVPICLRCARSLAPYGNHRLICSQCRSERPYYDRGFALVPYEEPIKNIFHQIKFQKKLWLIKIFSGLLERLPSSEMINYEMIVPVPLDSRRERERGFNQALIIAQMLSGLNLKNTPQIKKVLAKKKRTLPQSQLKREERLNNLENVFSLRQRGAVRGKQVLLVDDIFTTGTTINECARILKEDGAERVDFFTIARSQSS